MRDFVHAVRIIWAKLDSKSFFSSIFTFLQVREGEEEESSSKPLCVRGEAVQDTEEREESCEEESGQGHGRKTEIATLAKQGLHPAAGRKK